MLQLTVNSFSTVDSTTFVLYKSHISVCEFDHIPMLKCAIEVLNIIISVKGLNPGVISKVG